MHKIVGIISPDIGPFSFGPPLVRPFYFRTPSLRRDEHERGLPRIKPKRVDGAFRIVFISFAPDVLSLGPNLPPGGAGRDVLGACLNFTDAIPAGPLHAFLRREMDPCVEA